MWDPDNFPGADHVPWQLLIRARYAHEIDAVIASYVVARIGAVASAELTFKIAEVASQTMPAERVKATATARLNALSAIADFDDWPWCGTPPWPRHWPPKPRGFDDLSDAVLPLVLERAAAFVRAGGSEQLQGSLGEVLNELGGVRG